MPLETVPFDVAKHLTDSRDQAELLDDAFASGDAACILHALNIVARAKNLSRVARDAGVTREALYKALTSDGDPRLSTLLGVLRATGYRLHATPIETM